VTLKGVQDGNAVSYSLTFTLCEADNINASAAVHRLATKLQIKLLQDQDAESAAQRLQFFFFSRQIRILHWISMSTFKI
jgi:hypothetical protein